MVKFVEEKPISGRIDLRFEGFVSKCPFMTDMCSYFIKKSIGERCIEDHHVALTYLRIRFCRK